MAKNWMDRIGQSKGAMHLAIDMKSGKIAPEKKRARPKPAKVGKKK